MTLLTDWGERASSLALETQMLVMFVCGPQRFSLGTALFDDSKRRDRVIEAVKQEAAERGVSVFTLAIQPEYPLLATIRRHLAAHPAAPDMRYAIMLTEMEASLGYKADSWEPTRPELFQHANIMREAFVTECPVPLVLWLRPATNVSLVRLAPDLWHWRSATFDFTEPERRPVVERQLIGLQSHDWEILPPVQQDENLAVLVDLARQAEMAEDADDLRGLQRRWELQNQIGQAYSALGRTSDAVMAHAAARQLAESISQFDRGLGSAFASDSTRRYGDSLIRAGRSREGIQWLRQVTEIDEREFGPEHGRVADDKRALGRGLYDAGNPQEALRYYDEAREIQSRQRPQGDIVVAKLSLIGLERAGCLVSLGRLDEAADELERVARDFESVGDVRHSTMAEGQLGTVRRLQRRYPEALAILDEVRRTFEQLGEPGSVATAWHQIGLVHEEAGQYDRAEYAYRQSLQIDVSRGYRAGEADTLIQIGNLYSRQGRRDEAVRFYRQAADIYSAPDRQDLAGEGRARNNAAVQLIELGRYAEARREILRAIECLTPFGHAAQPWKSFHTLSNLERAVGDLLASAAARSRAIDSYRAFRRDGGAPMNQVAAMIASVGMDGRNEKDVRVEVEHLLRLENLPEAVRAAITTLQAILAGSRDPALAADPRLDYDAAAELLLLLERRGHGHN